MAGVGLIELIIIVGIVAVPLVVVAIVLATRRGGHSAPNDED